MASLSTKFSHKKAVFTVVIASLACGGCNLTGFMDSPSNDDQYLSAARACLDKGDIQCALTYYGKVSSSDADVANSETALAILDENGADMSAFMDFVGNLGDKDPGYAITKFAERLISGAGVTKRVDIWNAFNMRTQITSTALSGFVQFVGGIALTAELFAEAGNTQTGIFQQTDLVQTPSTCLAAGLTNCATTTQCDVPSSGYGSNLTATAVSSIATNSPSNTNPSLDQAYDALILAIEGLAKLAPSGRFQSLTNLTSGFSQLPTAYAEPSSLTPASDRCFREIILSNNIGE